MTNFFLDLTTILGALSVLFCVTLSFWILSIRYYKSVLLATTIILGLLLYFAFYDQIPTLFLGLKKYAYLALHKFGLGVLLADDYEFAAWIATSTAVTQIVASKPGAAGKIFMTFAALASAGYLINKNGGFSPITHTTATTDPVIPPVIPPVITPTPPTPQAPKSILQTIFGIRSPAEEEDWFNYLIHLLPESIQIELFHRLPHTTDYIGCLYTTLFVKYNLLIILIYYSALAIILCGIIMWVAKAILNNKTYLMVNYPRTIGLAAGQTSYLKAIIKTYIFCIILLALNIFQCILFLKYNYLPHDLGQMCDRFLDIVQNPER